MPSPKLTPALAAAAALLALAPAGAAARTPHEHFRKVSAPAGACQASRVSLRVERRVLTAGESALAFGVARCGTTPASGQAVTLYQRPAGASGFSTVGSATTVDKAGGYSIPTGVLSSNTAFYAVLGSVHSAQRTVRVAAQVTLLEEKALITNGAKTGKANAVTFTGSVNPNYENGEVILQRQNLVRGVGWATISKPTKVDREGKFSVKHTFVVPGASNIRVLLRKSAHNIASPSNELSFTISQAENPALTIESEQDPVPFEGATAIHGLAAGLANTPVTLLAHKVGGTFAPVATASTNPEGKYSFPVKPAASTLYRVESAGRKSTVLYEGVKYTLTALPPATVQSGQPLIVSGTVSPVKTNHPVLLQKKNTFGTGFHTVDEAKVEPDGKYTITDTLFVPATYTLRVKVPGDPENGAAATAPFTVTVEPVSAATIPATTP